MLDESWRETADPLLAKLVCEHCERRDRPVVGVCSVIAVPYSAAICSECLSRPATVPRWVADFWLQENTGEGLAPWVFELEVWDRWHYVQIVEYTGWKPQLTFKGWL